MRVVREQIDRPRFAEIHRLGPFPERGTDVDVVRDLMIHDIEILQQLLGAEPERVDAVGVPGAHRPRRHRQRAARASRATCVANLTASRVSATPMRKFRLFQRDAYFSIDFLAQKATLFRRVPTPDGGKKIEMQSLETDPEDALAAQLDVFVRGACDSAAPRAWRGVTGAQAAAALRTALRVIDAMPETDDARMSTVLLSVGDASGDVYAGDFVRELRARRARTRASSGSAAPRWRRRASSSWCTSATSR